jgi:hypothetical protein
MQKGSLKLYFATFLLTLILASFSLAGDVHCPLTEPPPDEGGRASVPVIVNANPTVKDTYQFLKGFWEIFAQSTDLF